MDDVAIADPKDHLPLTKTRSTYCLTNEIQKMVDLDMVFKCMLDPTLTVTAAEVLAMSPEMQKHVNLLTKPQKEYTAKTVRFASIPSNENNSENNYNVLIKTTLISNLHSVCLPLISDLRPFNLDDEWSSVYIMGFIIDHELLVVLHLQGHL